MKIAIWTLSCILIIAFILSVGFFYLGGHDQRDKLQLVKELYIYDCDPDSLKTDLSNITSVHVDEATTHKLFSSTIFSKGSIIWKGKFLAIGKLQDKTEIRLALSYYGAYFGILNQSGYYQFRGKSREVFESLMKDTVENKFIPFRKNSRP